MALRLYSEFTSHNGKEYKIEIHDNSWALPSSSFVVASDGFTLNYSGETDDIVSPIIGSNATISAYNNTDAFDSFINDLKEYQDNRFTVKIIVQDLTALTDFEERVINDGGIFEAKACLEDKLLDLNAPLEAKVFWTGVIMQDLVTIEDTHKPYIFKLTAVDGIGLLANKEYTSILNTTIESFIESAADAIGIDALYSATDILYATVVNVWDTQQTYSASTDVTTLTRFSALVFAEKEEDGTLVYSSYLDILKELCIAFGARFYQRQGVYYFEQYIERTQSTRTVSGYYKDGSKAYTQTVSDDVTLDQTTSGGARLAGNQFNFLPALKKVQVSFNQERASNLLANNITFTTITGRQDLGFVNSSNNGRLQIIGDLIYQLVHNGAPDPIAQKFWRPVWEVEIRVEDVLNPGTYYYLKRNWTPGSLGAQLYGATTWTTTPSYYSIDADIGINEAAGIYLSKKIGIVTPPLPVSGDATLDVNFDDVYGQNNSVQAVPVYFDEIVQSKNFRVLYLNDNGSTNEITVYSATNNDPNINSNLILDLGQLRVSDSTGLQGSFYVYDGTGWVPSTEWRRGNSGTYINLLKLLTNELLSLHKKPIERYMGTVVGAYPFGVRYNFDSGYWLPLSGSYNANLDEWSAEWFKVEKDETNIVTDTPVGSGGGADFEGRISSQQGTDEIINAVTVNTTTSEVTGNATVGGTLGVTGDISASSDIIASGDISAVDVSATNVTASNDITATGNVSGTDINASNNITANNQLTATNASLDNFVTKTAIIGSTALVDSFKTRVENDGGTFEAFDTVLDAVTALLIGDASKSAIIYGETSVETLDASKNISAVNMNATNVNASSNATVGGALSVSGTTTLQDGLSQQGLLIQNITEIEHEPGSSYDISDSEYMIFNKWRSGAANGSATINLPPAADYQGRLLRFKSDGSISSNQSINLLPESGESIDGNGEFEFNRSYDGVMILAHSGDWYIIQRKSK